MSNAPFSETWYEAATRWADLEAAADLLESTKSAVLSQLMEKIGGGLSVAKAEMSVKASQQWMDHVKKIAAARAASNKAKIDMEFQKMRFWESQSSAATERAVSRL